MSFIFVHYVVLIHCVYTLTLTVTASKEAVGRATNTICPAPFLPRGRRSALRRRADGNVAAVSHGQHVPTPPLQPPDAPTRGEQSVRVTTDVRQRDVREHHRLMSPPIRGGGIIIKDRCLSVCLSLTVCLSVCLSVTVCLSASVCSPSMWIFAQ